MSSKKPRRRPAAPRQNARTPAPAATSRRVPVRGLVGAAVVVVVLGVAVFATMGANTGSEPGEQQPVTCGWDFTSPEGVAANKEYLTRTADWLVDQPAGATPAPPDSPYWHGPCAAPSGAATDEPTGEDAP